MEIGVIRTEDSNGVFGLVASRTHRRGAEVHAAKLRLEKQSERKTKEKLAALSTLDGVARHTQRPGEPACALGRLAQKTTGRDGDSAQHQKQRKGPQQHLSGRVPPVGQVAGGERGGGRFRANCARKARQSL